MFFAGILMGLGFCPFLSLFVGFLLFFCCFLLGFVICCNCFLLFFMIFCLFLSFSCCFLSGLGGCCCCCFSAHPRITQIDAFSDKNATVWPHAGAVAGSVALCRLLCPFGSLWAKKRLFFPSF